VSEHNKPNGSRQRNSAALAKEAPAWYRLSAEASTKKLEVNPEQGLSTAEVNKRVQTYGPNELAAAEKEPVWRAFLRQFADYMQIMLLAAGIVSIIIGQYSTGVLLIGLTLVNAVIGYNQEGKAEESVAALKQMLHVQAKVRRDGKIVLVPAEELVPGDIVTFEAGDQVPADGRLLRVATLEIEESALTGESQPVSKDIALVDAADVPLGDRTDVAYMNTLVTRGTGEMVVTATGMDTEIGRIANLLDTVKSEKSPLQKQIDQLTKVLGYIALAAMVIVIGLGLARSMEPEELFLLAIAMAVAAIPTGMPTIVITLLSLGVQQMAEHNAIIKRLASVETLGSTRAICSDKTGTLTLNKMTATGLAYGGNRYTVSGVGYSDVGQIQRVGGTSDPTLEPVLLPMILCSDATVDNEEMVGDPTEGALVVLAAKGGLDVSGTRAHYPRLAEVPFDSAYKYMATFQNMVNEENKPVVRCYVKGAPDVLLGLSSGVNWTDGQRFAMEEARPKALALNEEMAAEGLRVMALAVRDIEPDTFNPDGDLQPLVSDLTLLGMVGIVDPPRPEAKDAIAIAKEAGITVRMITGDHAVTAGAIGDQLGITGEAIDGAALNEMSEEELAERVERIGVVGRVAPEHKVRIVQALQSRGEITAMTGDGVNDAPALKAADIGVAMGITGTEVSKQAAVMILTDDNFATIVKAVELGRGIYDNLQKYLRYQVINLMGLILLFIVAAIFYIAQGQPLTALQVLWINFPIQVPIALALGVDIAAPGLMKRPPRSSKARLLGNRTGSQAVIAGLVMAIATLVAEILIFDQTADTVLATTVALTTFSLAVLFVGLGSRSETRSIFNLDTLSNLKFLSRVGISLVAAILVTELGFLQRWFETASLSAEQWAVCILFGSAVLWVMEILKYINRRQK
jgi:Ca2+-transporting ATPase